MEFSLDIKGLDEIAETLGATLAQAIPGAAKGVAKAAEQVRDTAQDLVHVATGELRNSIHTTPVEIEGDAVEAKVIAGAEHALFVEMGTGPVGEAHHEGIDPSATPTYRTTGWVYPLKNGEGFRYTEGQPAKPFMYPAMKQTEDKAQSIIAEEVRKAVIE